MGVLGMETGNGDFEVVDLCFAGLPEVYHPKAGSSGTANGKSKAKVEESMDVDGGEHVIEVKSDHSQSGSRENLGCHRIRAVNRQCDCCAGHEGRAPGGVADGRRWWRCSEFSRVLYDNSQDQLQGVRIARLILAGNTLTTPQKGEDDKMPVCSEYTLQLTIETLLRGAGEWKAEPPNENALSASLRPPRVLFANQPRSWTIRSCRRPSSTAGHAKGHVWR